MPNPVDFNLYLITDRHQVAAGQTLLTAVAAALAGGVKAVQLREKDLSAAELFPLARELRALTSQYQAKLLINDRIDVALAAAADGVQLGAHSLPTWVARQLLGPDRLIGVSTHSLRQIAAATEQGADFVTFGPVYATPSKAAYGRPQGLAALSEACRQTRLPLFALGGITLPRRREVWLAGAGGVALISAIIGSDDPAASARAFLA